MSKIEWREPTREELHIFNDDVAALVAVGEADGAVALVSLGWMDGPPVAVEVLRMNGAAASTRSARQWPEVATVLPRHEWPREVYAGKNVEHDAEPKLRAMLDAAIAREEAAIAGTEEA